MAFPSLLPLSLPWISRVPLHKGFSWVPTWKSTPNDDRQFAGRKADPNIFSSIQYGVLRSQYSDSSFVSGWSLLSGHLVGFKDGPWTDNIQPGRPMRILGSTNKL